MELIWLELGTSKWKGRPTLFLTVTSAEVMTTGPAVAPPFTTTATGPSPAVNRAVPLLAALGAAATLAVLGAEALLAALEAASSFLALRASASTCGAVKSGLQSIYHRRHRCIHFLQLL